MHLRTRPARTSRRLHQIGGWSGRSLRRLLIFRGAHLTVFVKQHRFTEAKGESRSPHWSRSHLVDDFAGHEDKLLLACVASVYWSSFELKIPV